MVDIKDDFNTAATPVVNDRKNKRYQGVYIIICLVLLAFIGFIFYTSNKQEQATCTQEAKACPDGSSVSRTGPNCEFAPCPVIATNQQNLNASSTQETVKKDEEKTSVLKTENGWQILDAKRYGFSIEFPPNYSQVKFDEPGISTSAEGSRRTLLDARFQNDKKEEFNFIAAEYKTYEQALGMLKGCLRDIIKNQKNLNNVSSSVCKMLVNYVFAMRLVSAEEQQKEDCLFFISTLQQGGKNINILNIFPAYNKEWMFFVWLSYFDSNKSVVEKIAQTIKCEASR